MREQKEIKHQFNQSQGQQNEAKGRVAVVGKPKHLSNSFLCECSCERDSQRAENEEKSTRQGEHEQTDQLEIKTFENMRQEWQNVKEEGKEGRKKQSQDNEKEEEKKKVLRDQWNLILR